MDMNKEQYKLSMITSANAFVYVMYFQQSFTICAYKDAFYFWGEKKMFWIPFEVHGLI